MLFSDAPRTHYDCPPLREVVCQVRIPAILSISSRSPADFQEEIQDEFPRYVSRQEPQAPVSGTPRPPVINHGFLSEDALWRVNLTQDFFALSTRAYDCWEDFAGRLDRLLACFLRIYRPARFLRVGLRYINLVSRARLGLEDCAWTELIAPAYSSFLQEPDISDDRILAMQSNFLIKLDSSCRARIQSGLVKPQPAQKQNENADSETCFLLDLDLSMSGNLECALAAAALETLHRHGTALFQGALSDRLRDAMRPG